MDFHTANIYQLVKLSVRLHKSVQAHQIPAPRHAPNAALSIIDYPYRKPFRVSRVDDDEPAMPFLVRGFLRLNHRFAPFTDVTEVWADAASGREAMASTFGALLPPADVDWGDPTTDGALWRWVTQGNAAQRLERAPAEEAQAGEEGGFVVRCEWMARLEVRPPFAPYGGDAWFDAQGKPTRIRLRGEDVRPGSPDWEAAKFAFRASSFMGGAIGDHLVRCHQAWSNALSIGMLRSLPKAHPLRQFLKPFTYRGASINDLGALLFLEERGWLHRVSGLTWAGLTDAFNREIEVFRIERFDDELRRKGVHPSTLPTPELYPFGVEALAFWTVVDRFVHDAFDRSAALQSIFEPPHLAATQTWWADVASAVLAPIGELSPAALGNLIRVGIFTATAYHWHVQWISSYVRDPRFLSTRLVAGQTIGDRQAQTKLCTVTCVTGLPLPTIDGELGGHMPDEGARSAARDFRDALTRLQGEMDARNADRPQPYLLCEPRRVATSVGV